MPNVNAIEQRIEKISDIYGTFALDPGLRMLCLQLSNDEVRVFDAFLALQFEDEAAEHPDVFLVLEVDFNAAQNYAADLIQHLTAGYAAAAEGFAEVGLSADWQPPRHREAGPVDIAQMAADFAHHYQLSRHVTLVLRPSVVANGAEYAAFTLAVAQAAPPNVRLLVTELAGGESAWVGTNPDLVRVEAADLDMPAALQSLAESSADRDTPTGHYRTAYVRMGAALAQQEFETAFALGREAVRIATEQGWHHLIVPVHIAFAAAMVGAGRAGDALQHYEAGQHAVAAVEQNGPDYARSLVPALSLQVAAAHGSALIATAAWGPAGEKFLDAARLAATAQDPPQTLDYLRLAAFCQEQEERYADAWRHVERALEIARQIGPDGLTNTTFPYLGEAALRLVDRGVSEQCRSEMISTLNEIHGTAAWRLPAGLTG